MLIYVKCDGSFSKYKIYDRNKFDMSQELDNLYLLSVNRIHLVSFVVLLQTKYNRMRSLTNSNGRVFTQEEIRKQNIASKKQ